MKSEGDWIGDASLDDEADDATNGLGAIPLELYDGITEDGVPYRAFGRFEDLLAWQRARELSAAAYQFSRDVDLRRLDWSLNDQIRRSAASVMSNIAEGHERSSQKEFLQFLAIAKGSCGELRTQLYIALDGGFLEPKTFERLRSQAEEVSRLIAGLRSSIIERARKSALTKPGN